MATVKVGADGKAPKGLSAGTVVETAGGNFRITGVNKDGSYISEKAGTSGGSSRGSSGGGGSVTGAPASRDIQAEINARLASNPKADVSDLVKERAAKIAGMGEAGKQYAQSQAGLEAKYLRSSSTAAPGASWTDTPAAGLGGNAEYSKRLNDQYTAALGSNDKDLVSRIEAEAKKSGIQLSVAKDKPAATTDTNLSTLLSQYAGMSGTFAGTDPNKKGEKNKDGTYSVKFEDMTDGERRVFLGDQQGLNKVQGDYAYTDDYGMEHVASLADALAYSGNGNIQGFTGANAGGYALDSKGERAAIGLDGAVAYGNNPIDPATGKPTIGKATGTTQKADLASLLKGTKTITPEAVPAAAPATGGMSAADSSRITELGNAFGKATTEDEKVRLNQEANAIRAKNGVAAQVYQPKTAPASGVAPSTAPASAPVSSVSPAQAANTDWAAAWKTAMESGDIAAAKEAIANRATKLKGMKNVPQNYLDDQAWMEKMTASAEEKDMAMNPTGEDAIVQQLMDQMQSQDQETRSLLNQLSSFDSVELGDTLTFQEALNQAKAQLDPKYDQARQERLKTLDKDSANRGFYGQMSADKRKMTDTEMLENDRSSAAATLAQSLMNTSKDDAYRTASFASSERQNKLSNLLAQLQAKQGLTSQNVSVLSALLQNAQNKTTAKQNQANADRAYQLEKTQLDYNVQNMQKQWGYTDAEAKRVEEEWGYKKKAYDQDLEKGRISISNAKKSGSPGGTDDTDKILKQIRTEKSAADKSAADYAKEMTSSIKNADTRATKYNELYKAKQQELYGEIESYYQGYLK